MKKMLSLLLTVSMVLSLAVFPVAAIEAAPTVTLQPMTFTEGGTRPTEGALRSEYACGDTFMVKVLFTNLTSSEISLGAYGVKIAYDTNAFELYSYEGEEDTIGPIAFAAPKNGGFPSNWTEVINPKTPGVAICTKAGVAAKEVAVNGTAILGYLLLKVKSAAESGSYDISFIVDGEGEQNKNYVADSSTNRVAGIDFSETNKATLTINGALPTIEAVTLDAKENQVTVNGTDNVTVHATATSAKGSNITSAVTWSVSEKPDGAKATDVAIAADGTITVNAKATEGNYTIKAAEKTDYSCGDATQTLQVNRGTAEPASIVISGPDTVEVPALADATETLEDVGHVKQVADYDATVYDQYGVEMTPESVTWEYATPVQGIKSSLESATGVFKLASESPEGNVTIRATVTGTDPAVTASKQITVTKAPAEATVVTVSGADTVTIPTGDTPTPETYTAAVTDQYGAEMAGQTFQWGIQEESTGASIDENTGVLTVSKEAGAGTITLQAHVSGTKPAVIGTKVVTLQSVQFTKSADPTVVASPVYGAKWSEIVTDPGTYSAKIGTTEVQGTYSLANPNVIPSAGEQSYTILFNSTDTDETYKNIPAYTGTVTVKPKTLTSADLEKDGGSLTKTYDGTTSSNVTVKVKAASLVGTDTLTVTGAAAYNSENVAEANSIVFTPTAITTGNYALAATEKLTISGASITKAASEVTTAPTAKTLIYTGEAQALVNAGASSDGTVKYCLTEDGTYAADISTGTNAGSYTVWYKVAGDGNHNDSAPASVAVTITPKSAAVVWGNETYTYTGETLTAPTAKFVDVSVDVNCTVTETNGKTFKDAGDYSFTASTDNTNYTLTNTAKSVTVGKADLTDVSVVQNGTLTYNGEAQTAAVTTAATAMNSQSVSFTYCATENGDYTDAVPAFTDAGAHTVYYKAAAANHNTAAGSFTVTIDKKPISISGVEWDYTGAYTWDGEEKTVTLKASTLPVGVNVAYDGNKGTNVKNNYSATATLTAADTANTELSGSQPTALTWAIAKATCSDTVSADISVYYAGTENHTLSVSAFSGLPANIQKASISAAGTVTDEDGILNTHTKDGFSLNSGITAGKSASYTVTITSDNYNDITATVTVNAVNINVPWPDATKLTLKQNAKYGDTNADILKGFSTGTVNATAADTVTGKFSVKNAAATPDAGTTTVTLVFTTDAGQSVTGSFEKDYTIPAVAKRSVTLTSKTVSKTYDGTALTNGDVSVTGDGFYGEEGATWTVTGTQLDAGTSKNTFTYELKAGTKAANYEISKVEGDLTVNKITTPIVITANSKSKTYDGTALTDSGCTYTQGILVSGDELTVTVTGTQTDAGSSANTVTAYQVKRGATDVSANYTFGDTVSGTLTITKAPLTITAKDKTITYGYAPANDGVEYTGFVNSETASVLTTPVAYEYSYEQYGNVGAYVITPKAAAAANYNITFVPGALTVAQKEVSLNWSCADNATLYYNGSAQSVTAEATDTVNGDELAVTVVGGALTAIGSYTAKATALTGAKAGNYKLPTEGVTKAYTIVAALDTVTAASANGALTASVSGLTVKLSGYVETDKDVTLTAKKGGVTLDLNGDDDGNDFTIAAANVSKTDNTFTANGVTYTVDTSSVVVKPANVEVKDEAQAAIETPDGADADVATAANEMKNAATKGEGMNEAAPEVIKNAANDLPEGADKVEVTMSLKITPTEYDKTTGGEKLTIEIVPVVTMTYKDDNNAQVGNTKTETVSNAQILAPITISVKLPVGMPSENVFARHYLNAAKTLFEIIKVTVENGVASWQQNSFSPTDLFVDSRTANVSFRFADGHSQSVTFTASDLNAALPADSKAGYTFSGWNFFVDDMAVEGNPFKTLDDALLTALDGARTATQTVSMESVFAPAGGFVSPTYDVKISAAEHGTVTAGASMASAGSTVTLKVQPDKGFTLETLTVTDGKGNALTLTRTRKNTYTFVMPGSAITVAATFMEDNSMLNFFVDVPADAYFYDAVLWAAENEITNGVDNLHFAPDAECTRAQAVTFLWRTMGCPKVSGVSNPFTDVQADAYYYEAVLWAVKEGITKGTSTTTFSPDATVTRGEIVTFLYRTAKGSKAAVSNPFTDVEADSYYSDAVLWAVKEEITNGTSATTFSPADNCVRGQMVTFLYRGFAEEE